MQIKALAIAAAFSQATATLDLLSGRPLSEAIFGLSSQQVKNVDNTLARAEATATAGILDAYTSLAKTLGKIIGDINKNSGPAIADASAALEKALTPDVRQKLKKAINSLVDSTLNALL